MILCACMVFFGAKMNICAEEREEEIKVGDTKKITIELLSDEVVYRFVPEEDGTYIFSSVNIEDDEYSYVYMYTDDGDDSLFNNYREMTLELHAGKTYYFRVGSFNPGVFSVTLEKSNLKSIIFEPVSTEYTEEIDGYMSDDQIFYYYIKHSKGDKLTLVYDDGSEKEYKYGFAYSYNYKYVNVSDETDVINSIDLDFSSNQLKSPWVVGGKNNYYTVTYRGCSYDVYVNAFENPVESISFTSSKPITIDEHTGGYWVESDGVKWYYYYPPTIFKEGTIITLNNKDGSSVDYYFNHDDESGVDSYISEDGSIIRASDYSDVDTYIEGSQWWPEN